MDDGRLSDFSEGGFVVLSADSRPLRRLLRPQVWMTLEEVALEAIADNDDQLIARTSARQVAERLRIDPAATAWALRVLRQRGLVELKREKDSADRFGLSTYWLGPITGIAVFGKPDTARPTPVLADTRRPTTAAQHVAISDMGEQASSPSPPCPQPHEPELGSSLP